MISQKLRSRLGAPRILVVDDEVQLAEIYRAVLQNAGAKVKVAYDAADAIDLIQSFGPDLIVSDIRMPEVRGDELLVALSRYNANLPIILITGLDRSHVAVPSEAENLFQLLYKPIGYEELIRTVQSAITLVESRRMNEILLKEIHTKSGVNQVFEEWRDEEINRILHAVVSKAS